ncbi:MAG: hypothetical protein AB2L14_12115 [Candidatus Xenobiia bacterium LiM19]
MKGKFLRTGIFLLLGVFVLCSAVFAASKLDLVNASIDTVNTAIEKMTANDKTGALSCIKELRENLPKIEGIQGSQSLTFGSIQKALKMAEMQVNRGDMEKAKTAINEAIPHYQVLQKLLKK